MWYSIRTFRPRRIIAAILLTLQLAACTGWKRTRLAPSEVESQQTVRVTTDRGRYVLHYPVLSNDSLFGRSASNRRSENGPTSTYRFALDDIRAMEVRQFHAGKTVLFLVGVGVTVALIGAATAEDDPPPPPPRSPQTPGGGDYVYSCPLVYSWDGETWRLDSGTFGGAISRGFARTDVDNLEYALPADGRLRLRIAAELDETEYVDRLEVLAVDHDPGVTIAPDPTGGIHTIARPQEPLIALDDAGRDVLERVRWRDGWNWESRLTRRNTADPAQVRDGVELAFVRPAGATSARLVVDATNTPWASYLMYEFLAARGVELQAWYDSVDAMPAYAAAAREALAREAFLSVSLGGDGAWIPQGILWEAGPEVVKRQVLPLDLSGIAGDTVRVRLESVPSFWLLDYVALDFSAPGTVEARTLPLDRALDRRGRDVRALVAEEDARYYVMEQGDAADLSFVVPPETPGRARSFVLRSTGWYRIHTYATGPADLVALEGIGREPLAVSRAATERLNQALAKLEGR